MTTIKDILDTMEYGPSPEASDAVTAWIATAPRGHFINGRFTDAADTPIAVTNPATGQQIAQVAKASAEDVDTAVRAARAAQAGWAALPGHDRARYLYAIARHVQKRERFLSVLETIDNGKPIRETRDIDIPLVARHFYHHAGWASGLGDAFPGAKPAGVCAQVIPWNFPLLMLAWKVAPALAAGNTVVLKPAEQTPLSAIAFAEICAEIGLPDGVVNIVQGDGETGAALCGHPDVDKVAFTGSTEVGRIIRRQLAGSGKKLSLELGGKSPFIVMADADLDSAVEGVVDSIWFNQGEVCCAGSRLLVQEGIAPRFYAKLKDRLATMRVGDPLDKSTDVGAIVSAEQHARITELLAQGRAEGADLHQCDCDLPADGFFVAPGFFTDAEPASTVAQVEIFGPIAAAMTFRTPSEALELANQSNYGLAASIWSENISVALDLAAGVKAGIVWINCANQMDAAAGFGGMKESGFGREGGREGMFEYLLHPAKTVAAPAADVDFSAAPTAGDTLSLPGIDRTMKMYIGGKQARPDGGASYAVRDAKGAVTGLAGIGSRKDIRNAVEAAARAGAWAKATAHSRAQVLYYLAENLDARRDDFIAALRQTGASDKAAQAEFDAAIRRIFWYAGQADKFDGAVHSTNGRQVTVAMNEPWGVVGIGCPDSAPLLGLVSMLLPLIAMGNRVVAVPSPRHPLIAGMLYQVLDTSDVPGGVVNFVTGDRAALVQVLAAHDAVAAVWSFGDAAESTAVEAAAAGNLKPTFVGYGQMPDWQDDSAQGTEWLRRAVQVKNIWLPYGA
ncbi:aldehyde dehydrogenase family protein [Paracoccus jiaweipingae]|uniref:aldehyde dehydrogenase family protein n=1 Tax=unclassified Paracoccus (in: a-proteobacteria) TaxID=2688777 RepID=UPI003791F9D8